MASSKPNCFPKTSPPNTTTLGVRASTQGFGAATNIQSATLGGADAAGPGTTLREPTALWSLAKRKLFNCVE